MYESKTLGSLLIIGNLIEGKLIYFNDLRSFSVGRHKTWSLSCKQKTVVILKSIKMWWFILVEASRWYSKFWIWQDCEVVRYSKCVEFQYLQMYFLPEFDEIKMAFIFVEKDNHCFIKRMKNILFHPLGFGKPVWFSGEIIRNLPIVDLCETNC